jgi:hypothetical protein
MATMNPLRRLLGVLPSDPLQVGALTGMHSDGTATVGLAGGSGAVRVRNPQAITSGQVFVQSGQITGQAPDLPVVSIEI